MPYVTRRIEIQKHDGTFAIVSDAEFSAIDAPLVLLGEPGAGKTETAQALASHEGRSYFRADGLASGAPAANLADTVPVVDGLDEVQGSGAEAPIIAILRRLEANAVPSFVITCRAAEWADVQNLRSIETWHGRKPVVGRLQPLNDDEIAEMVEHFGGFAGGGQEFLSQAAARDALDLARNPQALRLLLAAISQSGWPETKAQLYGLACSKYVTEENDLHSSLAPNRPSHARLLSVAGYVSAQLLLCGRRGVNVDGQNDDAFPRTADFVRDGVSVDDLRATVGTVLFKSAGPGCAEPIHKTVAEYLGAKWLSEQLQSGRLSFRRLQTILYQNGTVPGPLPASGQLEIAL